MLAQVGLSNDTTDTLHMASLVVTPCLFEVIEDGNQARRDRRGLDLSRQGLVGGIACFDLVGHILGLELVDSLLGAMVADHIDLLYGMFFHTGLRCVRLVMLVISAMARQP